jgi:hypothetical protein
LISFYYCIAPDNLNDRPECGTYGCRGIGHVKGPKFATHNSASGCPYSPQNLNKSGQMPDRLNLTKGQDSHEAYDYEQDLQEKIKLEKSDRIKIEKSEKSDKLLFSDEGILMIDKEIKEEGDSSDKNDKCENRSENSDKYVECNNTNISNGYEIIAIYLYHFVISGLTSSRICIATDKRMMMKFRENGEKGLLLKS